MNVRLLSLALLTAAGSAPAQGPDSAGMEFLDNGVLRVGLSKDHGGALAYLSLADQDDNLINVHDLGRYVQQSYYSGPKPYLPAGAKMHDGWPGWGWNPIQAGDVFDNRPELLGVERDGESLIVRSVPMQWALDGVPGECVFETRVRLDANRVHLEVRLENARSDQNRYPGQHQELPAVYTIGRLHRLFTYTGDKPFQGDALTEIENAGPPWDYWNSTESWSALVDDEGFGLGVFHPGVLLTVGGFHGPKGRGGPRDGSTGYIAPLHTEVLDHDIVYESRATLIVGDLEKDIRAYAKANRPDPRPDFDFTKDRAHCVPFRLTDEAPPYEGSWRLTLDQDDPHIVAAPVHYEAKRVPKLYLRAAYRTKAREAELYFAPPGGAFDGERRVTFRIKPDGKVRTYEIDLSRHPLYEGVIGQIRIDPIIDRTESDTVDFVSLRARK
jgi:hypothetical protein